MFNRITSSIATCTIFGFIATFCPPLYGTDRVMAQSPCAQQDELSKLCSEVFKRGKSPEDVNRAMRDKFPKSSFPYYGSVDGCSTPWFLSFLPATIINNGRFRSACDNHDRCYMTPGRSKFSCDNEMFENMSKICASQNVSCLISANEYYYGVDKYGQKPYDTSLREQTDVAETAPLQANEDGVILVGNTRVTLDTVVAVFNQGVTAEEIVYRYPSLNLADVYATIAFYLKHQSEVEAYLQQRRQRSQEVRAMNQARFDPQGLRDRLLARRTEQEAC